MGMVNDLITTSEGKIILSVIWGLGLATMFQRVCKGRSCIILKGPSPTEMNNKIYKFDDKCYLYSSELTGCKKK